MIITTCSHEIFEEYTPGILFCFRNKKNRTDDAARHFEMKTTIQLLSVLRIEILTSVAGLIIAFAPICHANLVSNDGFETGDFSNWTISGSFACVAASARGGNIVDPGADPGPNSGNYAAYLGGCGDFSGCGSSVANALTQTLATVPGQGYTLDYFLAAPTDGGTSTPNSLMILWDSSTIDIIMNLVSNSYIEYTYFVIGSGSDVLEFDTMDYPAAFVLDDISVEATPEPSTMLLIGFGLVAMVAARSRFRAGTAGSYR
jgi:hypothetical protein